MLSAAASIAGSGFPGTARLGRSSSGSALSSCRGMDAGRFWRVVDDCVMLVEVLTEVVVVGLVEGSALTSGVLPRSGSAGKPST